MRDAIAQLMGKLVSFISQSKAIDLGVQRVAEEGHRLPPYDDRSVCRAYLLDSCPREILADTRLENLLTCRKMHEKAHRADYLREQEKRDHFYELEVCYLLLIE